MLRKGFSQCYLVVILLFGWHVRNGEALSSPPPSSRRRDMLVKAPLGTVFAYAYGRAFYNTLQNIGIKHPEEHESRVKSTIATALSAAAPPTGGTMRVLEVGIGTDCRILRRGLYQDGLQSLKNKGIDEVELLGIDLRPPDDKTLQLARRKLQDNNTPVPVHLRVMEKSITKRLPFADGYFDAVLCCLTLCSVDDPVAAVREMHRLLRPDGGALGFVEHVAVNPDETEYAFLEQQQVFLDPWQQRLADNCHLHRYTEQTLLDNLPQASLLQEERFLVNAMWPVSMQACGVFQRTIH